MATCKQTGPELIQDVFSPCIAVVCGGDVESVCSKNNLTFVEMIQPFCRLNTEVTIRDPSNLPCNLRNLRVQMRDMSYTPLPLNVGKKVMHDAVASNASEGVLQNSIKGDSYELKYSASTPWFEAYREVFFQVVTPTEHEFLHHYLSCIFVVSSSHSDPLSEIQRLCQEQQQCQLNSRYNTRWFFSSVFKYYLLLHDTSSENLAKAEAIYQSMKSSFGATACHLLQINSSPVKSDSNNLNSHEDANEVTNLPDPWSQFLSYMQQDSVLNDSDDVSSDDPVQSVVNEGESDESIRTVDDNMIQHPLLNCSKELPLANESPISTPKRSGIKSYSDNTGSWGKSNRHRKHGLCLTLGDMERIRVFVQDFCIQGLVPFVEKQIRILQDQVTNRKSIHRTLFGVTKKLFTGNKPGMQNPVASSNSVVYGHDAPELQVRKLGDLSFMFQLYEVAYQAYHTAKKDFSGEAWLHFAGASEMAALSVFMQRNSNAHEYPARYMEAAITTYLYTCKLPELAIRSTLLSTECLKSKGLYRDAALQFNRILTEADLPSALLLEQAAHCSINCNPPYIRKYTFNLILAGHRFSKCGQRKHTLRAYKQVEQTYEKLGWNAARNHIKSLIGRTSSQLKQIEMAYETFHQLLNTQTEQPSIDQSNCLRDYLCALEDYLKLQNVNKNYLLPSLPIPIIDCQSTKVLLGEEDIVSEDGSLLLRGRGFLRGDLNNDIWAKLEEVVIVSLYKNLPALHSPQMHCFTQSTNNNSKPICIASEKIIVQIFFKNPLSIAFAIEKVFLLWTFTSDPDSSDSNQEIVSYSNELHSGAEFHNTIVETEVLPEVIFEPYQEKCICLTLKPLHTGSLLIRGLLYSLRGPIVLEQPLESAEKPSLSLQGKQLIEVIGRRLNRTAAERATTTYSTDYRLNLQVISPMPKLQVKYKSFPSTLFCGEIYQTVVEFSNIGAQPLTRVVVASTMPSLFFLGNSNQVNDSMQIYKEVPCSFPADVKMVDWGNCSWIFEIRPDEDKSYCLDSDETLSLPMWIRGPHVPGSYDIELLYYYESEPVCPKIRHRLVQHSFTLNAKPSLHLEGDSVRCQCSFLPNTPDMPNPSSLYLSLDIKNCSEELPEISVVQVTCASPTWHIAPIDDCTTGGICVIKKEEVLMRTLKLYQPENIDSSPGSMMLSRVSYSCFDIDSCASPCSDFICRALIRPESITADFQNTSKLEILRSENVLTIAAVIWKANICVGSTTRVVMGQHHIVLEKKDLHKTLSSIQSGSASFAREIHFTPKKWPCQYIDFYLEYPYRIKHNFEIARLLTVKIDLVIVCTSSQPVHVLLDNSEVLSRTDLSNSFRSTSKQNFVWTKGSKTMLTMEPKTVYYHPLVASFSCPGIYNLERLNIQVRREGEAEYVNYYIPPAPFVVCTTNYIFTD